MNVAAMLPPQNLSPSSILLNMSGSAYQPQPPASHRVVEVFKTAVASSSEAALVLQILKAHFPSCRINFDLQDCDRILRIEGEKDAVDANRIVQMVKRHCAIQRMDD